MPVNLPEKPDKHGNESAELLRKLTKIRNAFMILEVHVPNAHTKKASLAN